MVLFMTTLKQAQSGLKTMKQFITDHEADIIASEDFDKVMGSMLPKVRNRVAKSKKNKA